MAKKTVSTLAWIAGLGLGAGLGRVAAGLFWMRKQFSQASLERSLAGQATQITSGLTYSAAREAESYTVHHTIQDGIERIRYLPRKRRFETPILMQHGMWHGAWCWQPWQELLAGWGWESVAASLPGHGRSPAQRPIRECTLDYYLGFLKDEAERLPRKPVIMGHSLGGALTQWYLKYVGDDLPAVLLVAPWTSHNALRDSFPLFLKLDPLGLALAGLDWSAAPFIRTPGRAARMLLSPKAIYSPAEFHSRLGPESLLIMFQHNPPYWLPPEAVQTPMLLLAGERDAVVPLEGLRRSAAHYHADFLVIKDAAHNIMMELNTADIAGIVQGWLASRKIA